MVIGAKLVHGDMLLFVTHADGPTWLVAGITEWIDGSYTYRLKFGLNTAEAMAEELTPIVQDGKPVNLDQFSPGEGLSSAPVEEEDDSDDD